MSEATKFHCPNCDAEYDVARLETPPKYDRELLCIGCGGPLQSHNGKFSLKYSRTDGKRRQIPQGLKRPRPDAPAGVGGIKLRGGPPPRRSRLSRCRALLPKRSRPPYVATLSCNLLDRALAQFVRSKLTQFQPVDYEDRPRLIVNLSSL